MTCFKHAGKESFTIPCRECTNCLNLRKIDLVNRFKELSAKQEITSVELWTFGTNWNFKIDRRNYLKIKSAWDKFMKRLRNTLKYYESKFEFIPLFRAYEYGKAGYLHVHLITIRQAHRIKITYKNEYYSGIHALARKIWSDVTDIKDPNVNYSYRPSFDPMSAFKYATKYVSKSINKLPRAYYMHKPLWRKLKNNDIKIYDKIMEKDYEIIIETKIRFECDWMLIPED